MTSEAIKNMRKKQFIFINAVSFTVLMLYMVVVNYSGVNLSNLIFLLGAYLLIQSVYFLIKKDSTKSWIPIVEQVRTYEKEKMGKEWKRQNKASYVVNIFLGGFLMFQSSWFRDMNTEYSIDIRFFMVFIIALLVAINIMLLLHAYKVDRSTNEADLKGYTWKTTLIGLVAGLLLAGVLIMVTVFYVLSTI
ncbi:hypothetical protein [Virgibacillus doumboii]|uniref:hypothetical protein n=1 Tax=Virgibacillus doumboii TaxID=2697503 RepID=UPI0013E0952D|nr:hypothetical protein [Virgibacillus doumboii]